jgi:2-dehydropantoate 2-reductase
MRFIIYGAGGIGGVLGGRLFEAGHAVTLIARGDHFAALRDNGLRIEAPDRTVTLPVPVVDDPRTLALTDDDVVILAMKSQDTAAALDQLRAASGAAGVAVVCAQNGVANERAAVRRFANVYGICVMCPTSHLEPGVVQAHSTPVTGILDIGRYPHGVDAIAETVAAALGASSFVSEARADIMRWKHQKLLMNLANAVEAACGPDARASDIAARARDEGIAAYRAAGIAFASDEEDRERRGSLLTMHRIDGRKRGGGSSWQSLARGSGSIETDYLNGEIVLLGRLHGVPTPVNELLQRVARELALSGAPPGSLAADDLLARVS